MNGKTLHIVCFDVPYPVRHGGFFDLFYKLKALHAAGCTLLLHCFGAANDDAGELKKYCHSIFVYKRTKGWRGFSLSIPYIVSSRRSGELLNNLSGDNHPILFEGTHCTYALIKKYFSTRLLLYRLHNIEHLYYYQLFLSEHNLFKKAYYGYESLLLKRYEKKVGPQASVVLAVSEKDAGAFRTFCPDAIVTHLPVFIPFSEIKSKAGVGSFCLYHGNLSIAENEKAASRLCSALGPTAVSFVIAGLNPSKKLKKEIAEYKNVALIENPPDAQLETLIRDAHINLIYSFNKTGIKLKLINALFNGRYCVVNDAAVSDGVFSICCTVADTTEAIQVAVRELMQENFTDQQIQMRKTQLLPVFNNEKTAQTLMQNLP